VNSKRTIYHDVVERRGQGRVIAAARHKPRAEANAVRLAGHSDTSRSRNCCAQATCTVVETVPWFFRIETECRAAWGGSSDRHLHLAYHIMHNMRAGSASHLHTRQSTSPQSATKRGASLRFRAVSWWRSLVSGEWSSMRSGSGAWMQLRLVLS
jgi:hypothetical protein